MGAMLVCSVLPRIDMRHTTGGATDPTGYYAVIILIAIALSEGKKHKASKWIYTIWNVNHYKKLNYKKHKQTNK